MSTTGLIITAVLLLSGIECATDDERKIMQLLVRRSLTNTAGIGPHEIFGQPRQYAAQNDIANRTNRTLRKHTTVKRATERDTVKRHLFLVTYDMLKFDYWNAWLGKNTSVRVEFGNEKKLNEYWIPGRPLKLLVHGWIRSTSYIEIASITSGYMATGNYNIITADWNALSNDLTYVIPAFATVHLGTLIARFLENIVELGFIEPSGVHLIGHSLGAHICGATGGAFGPGKIGRITGLDPGTIGFETVNVVRRLNVDDARFVDVIHTSVGTIFGFVKPLGHVDFYANLGVSPQPRCKDEFAHSPFSRLSQSICSHFRACQYFVDSIYNGKSFMAVQCPSAKEYKSGRCKNNTRNFMGNDVDFEKKGIFYLEATTDAPSIGFVNVFIDYLRNIKKILRTT